MKREAPYHCGGLSFIALVVKYSHVFGDVYRKIGTIGISLIYPPETTKGGFAEETFLWYNNHNDVGAIGWKGWYEYGTKKDRKSVV